MKLLKYIITFTILSNLAFAQGGSNYSMYGIGDIYDNLGASYEAMGGVGISVPSATSINLKNPAMWSFVRTTRLQVGYHFNQKINEDEKSNILYQNNGGVNEILGIFAIDTSYGIAVSFGFLPYSSVNYMIDKRLTIPYSNVNATGVSQYRGEGGVSSAFLGAAFSPFKWLKLGLAANIFFGNIEHSINTVMDYNDISYYSYDSKFSRTDNIKGGSFKAGLFIEPIENLYFAFAMEKVFQSRTTTEMQYGYLHDSIPDVTSVNYSDINLPDMYSFGLSYKWGKVILGTELTMKNFEKISMYKGDNVKFRNTQQYAFGLSRLGNTYYRAGFFDKITYNIGVGYKQLYYNINNEDINEIYGSFGFDIPVVGAAMLNTAFTFGVRGKAENGLLKEAFGRMNINISLGEVWFIPFEQEY